VTAKQSVILTFSPHCRFVNGHVSRSHHVIVAVSGSAIVEMSDCDDEIGYRSDCVGHHHVVRLSAIVNGDHVIAIANVPVRRHPAAWCWGARDAHNRRATRAHLNRTRPCHGWRQRRRVCRKSAQSQNHVSLQLSDLVECTHHQYHHSVQTSASVFPLRSCKISCQPLERPCRQLLVDHVNPCSLITWLTL